MYQDRPCSPTRQHCNSDDEDEGWVIKIGYAALLDHTVTMMTKRKAE